MTTRASLLFEGVWKRFRRGQRVDSLRDLVLRAPQYLWGREVDEANEAFWALQDVTIEVPPGQVLGVIGPNGSGKSTLLKLAAQILRPDRGRLVAQGKVGALIELAAGSHGELTGKENIFLQGAVMGLKRSTIRKRFDEIVEFAGLEAAIETPVKRYSSGMNARLGFSIAAHMDPDLFLIDEVLAVGDREFQSRAVERMEEIVRREIPVVIVSHQLDRILKLADQAVLLVEGRVVARGTASEVVSAYIDGAELSGRGEEAGATLRLEGFAEPPPEVVRSGEPLTLQVAGTVADEGADPNLAVGVVIRTIPEERVVFSTDTMACGIELPERGPFTIAFDLIMSVGPGLYGCQTFMGDPIQRVEMARKGSAMIEVEPDGRIRKGSVNLQPRARLLQKDP